MVQFQIPKIKHEKVKLVLGSPSPSSSRAALTCGQRGMGRWALVSSRRNGAPAGPESMLAAWPLSFPRRPLPSQFHQGPSSRFGVADKPEPAPGHHWHLCYAGRGMRWDGGEPQQSTAITEGTVGLLD